MLCTAGTSRDITLRSMCRTLSVLMTVVMPQPVGLTTAQQQKRNSRQPQQRHQWWQISGRFTGYSHAMAMQQETLNRTLTAHRHSPQAANVMDGR